MKPWSLQVVLTALMIASAPNPVSATSYYVSKEGSDSFSGTSPSSPWRTLAKASTVVYQPGDALYIKRGLGLFQRRWQESLVLQGGGTPTNPVIVTSYGTGQKPIVAPGIVDSSAIRIVEGGWQIFDLELANARWGVELRYDNVSASDPVPSFVWLEDLFIRDMTSALNSAPEKYNAVSAAIAIRQWTDEPGGPDFLQDLTLKNITIENANFGIWTGAICEGQLPGGGPRCTPEGFSQTGLWAYLEGFNVENVTVSNAAQTGLSLGFLKSGTLTNTTVSNVGFQGWQYGTAGVILFRTTDVVIEDLAITNVSRFDDPDGCGIDFEGGNLRTTYRNSEVLETDGAGICVYDNNGNAGPNRDLLIQSIDVTRFGRRPYENPPLPQSEGLAFHLTTPATPHTGEIQSSVFNNFYNRGFIGTYGQPTPPTAPHPDGRFWLNNCCAFSSVRSSSGTASATSWHPDHPPAHAIDSNPLSYWEAGSQFAELWLDMQANYTITRVEQRFNSAATWRFKLLGTLDTVTWVTIADYSAGFNGDTLLLKVVGGQHHWLVLRFEDPLGPVPTSRDFVVYGY